MPSNDQPSKPSRIRLTDVRVDIEGVLVLVGYHAAEEYQADMEREKERAARIMAFLDQCEADEKRLERARKACKAIVEATTKAEITQARGQALDALADN